MMWSGLEPSEGEVYYGHYIAVIFWFALREISEKLWTLYSSNILVCFERNQRNYGHYTAVIFWLALREIREIMDIIQQ